MISTKDYDDFKKLLTEEQLKELEEENFSLAELITMKYYNNEKGVFEI